MLNVNKIYGEPTKTSKSLVYILPKTNSVIKSENTENEKKIYPKRTYKCQNCGTKFASFTPLQRHNKEQCIYRNRNFSDANICDYCFTLYASANTIAQHCTNKEYICLHCKHMYKTKGYLIKHMSQAHHIEDLPYYCSICETNPSNDFETKSLIATRADLFTHYDEHHRQSQSSAESITSDAELSSFEMLEEFLDFNNLSYVTNYDEMEFDLPDIFDVPPTPTLNNLTYATNYDKMEFDLPEIFDLPPTATFECPKCRVGYQSANLLLRHIKSQHTQLTQQLTCLYCKKSCRTELNLRRHIERMHKLILTHICYFCERKFATMDHLKKHVQSMHLDGVGVKPFICDICGAVFHQCGHMKQHRLLHEGEAGKLYVCNTCTKRFWRKIDLNRHNEREGHG